MNKIILLFILITSISFGGTINMIGEKGNPAEVSKVVTVKMYDNYYEPNKFEIKKAKKVFSYSIFYLFLLFVLFLVDQIIK